MSEKKPQSRAHQRFALTHDRACATIAARGLMLKMLKASRVTPNENEQLAFDTALSDMVRLATTLGVASMDTYFTARFAELLVPYIKSNGPTPGLVQILSDAGLDTELGDTHKPEAIAQSNICFRSFLPSLTLWLSPNVLP